MNSLVADRTEFWWNPKRPDDRTLWESKIELGEKFFEEVIRHPVPLDLNILKTMKRSSLGLDLYMWLTYRTFALKRPLRSHVAAALPAVRRGPSQGGRLGAPWTASVRSVSACWRRFSARGRTCTVKGGLVVSPSPPRIAPSQLRLVDAGRS